MSSGSATELSPDAALIGALAAAVVTVATVLCVSRYDDEFVQTNNGYWLLYAGSAFLTYILVMCMAVFQQDKFAYIIVFFGAVSCAALLVWDRDEQRRLHRRPLLQEAPLIFDDDNSSSDDDDDSTGA